MIKTHDGVLKNTIKTFLVFFYSTPVLSRCDVIIWTKFYKNANISSTTNGKLTKSVSNFRKFNNPSNELSLKWIISTCRTPWSVLIASGRFFEENYRRAYLSMSDSKYSQQPVSYEIPHLSACLFI